MTENKPVAWLYDASYGRDILSAVNPSKTFGVTNVRPVYEHPPVPQPDPDPAVEAARRKALKAVFAALEEYPWACDTAVVTTSYGVLRDLVGQPRKYPERAIRGYDNDGPPGPHPVLGEKGERAPARLSTDELIQIIADAARVRPQFGNVITYGRVAIAVHEAIYGKDA